MMVENLSRECRDTMRFLEIYKGICDFSIDQSYKDRKDLYLPRPSHINYSEFFEYLYVERPQERNIKDSLYLSSDIILLVGEKGSGKTSLVHKIKHDLEKSGGNDFLFFVINARTADSLSKPLDQIPAEEISEELMDALKRKYMEKVFTDQPTGDDHVMPVQRLAAYIISNEEKPDGYEFGALVHPLRRKFREQYKNVWEDPPPEPPEETFDNILKWLVGIWDRDNWAYFYIYNTLFKAPSFKTSFLMHAAHSILKYKRQYIWIDNVDALSSRQQSRVQSALRRLASSVSEFANVGISVRSENIVIEDEFEEHQAPPRVLKVLLYLDDEDDLKAREVYAVQLEEITLEDFKSIVRRRLNFASRNFVSGEIDIEKQSLETIKKHRNKVRLETITEYSNKIVNLFERIDAIGLANNSIRYLLRQHHGFLKNIIEVLDCEPKRLDDRSIHTLFLAWIGTNPDTRYQFSLLDWLHHVADDGEVKYFLALFEKNKGGKEAENYLLERFLHFMVLTRIWNLSKQRERLNKKIYGRPSIKDLKKSLAQRLRIDENDINQILFSLYRKVADEDTPRLIEIQNPLFPTLITSPDSIKDDFIVGLTPRAKSILRYVLNTYGYIASSKEISSWGELQMRKKLDTKKFILKPFQEKDAWNFIKKEIILFGGMTLCYLALMRNYYKERNWFENYLREFGIPIPMHWSVGYRVGGSKRALQYQLILSFTEKFFTNHEITHEIASMRNNFREEVEKIKTDASDCTSLLKDNLFFQAYGGKQ